MGKHSARSGEFGQEGGGIPPVVVERQMVGAQRIDHDKDDMAGRGGSALRRAAAVEEAQRKQRDNDATDRAPTPNQEY